MNISQGPGKVTAEKVCNNKTEALLKTPKTTTHQC